MCVSSSWVGAWQLTVAVCRQYLYTLCVKETDKAEKLTKSLPPGLQRIDIGKRQ